MKDEKKTGQTNFYRSVKTHMRGGGGMKYQKWNQISTVKEINLGRGMTF